MSNGLTDIEKQAHLLDQEFVKRAFNSWNPKLYDAQQFRSGRKTYSKDIKNALNNREISMYGGLKPELYDKLPDSDNSAGVFYPEINEGFLKKGSSAGTLNHEIAHFGRMHKNIDPNHYLAEKYNPKLNLLDKLDRDIFKGYLPFTPFKTLRQNQRMFGKDDGANQYGQTYRDKNPIHPYDTQYMFDKVAENTEYYNSAADSINQGLFKYAFNDYDSRVARGEIEPNLPEKEPLTRRAIKSVRGWMGLD